MRITKIGQSSVIKQLAIGGQAKIYQIDKQDQNLVAKVYDSFDEYADILFHDQRELLNMLDQKSILKALRYIDNETITLQNNQILRRNVIVMPYMKNGDLMEQVQRNGKLDQKIIRNLAKNILDALAYLSRKDVCHCDLKLQNILLNDNFKPQLIDFGFSTLKKQIDLKILPRQYYIAPQVKKGLCYNEKSQAFSLGVLLFILSQGCLPFRATKHTDLTYRLLLEGKHKQFWQSFQLKKQKLNQKINPKLKQCIQNLLEPNPRRRWSYQDFMQSQWLNQQEICQKQYLQYFINRNTTNSLSHTFSFKQQNITTDNQQIRSKQMDLQYSQ